MTTMDPNWEDELESHRFELTRVLRPDRYFEKFRSERILDESDTQVISNETKNPTRDKKAGQFLDIVRERGHVAYKLLLECMEADHPDLYKNITGINPEPKSWTIGLSKNCSCECHDDRISLDLMEAYKKEKQQNISLKKELAKLAKSVDKGREEKLKLKHVNETLTKQLDVLQSETGDIQKLKDDIQWKRFQICDLQAKAYEAQTQLISSNDKLRKVNLDNSALENKVREAQARLTLQRKKSTRLEQERSTDRMQASETLRSLVDQLHELGLDRAKKMEDSYKPTNNDVHDQTKLEIMVADKQEAVTKCEETVNELVKVRKQLYEVQEAKTKLQAENEELDTADTLLREERDMVMERLEMAQEELTQVSAERSQAISERNRSFEETARSMLERDDLVKKLNNERQSFLKQTRQLFEYKSKVQRLKRDKRLILQDGHPSLASSLSMDGSYDSKRSSGANEVSYLEGGNGGAPSNDTAKPTAMADGSSSKYPHSKRSISEINQSCFDADDDDDLADYEYPVGRKRSQLVSPGVIPAAVQNRRASNASKSDNPAELTSRPDTNEDRDSRNGSGIDQANERSNSVLDSLPCDVNEKIGTLWSDFDYSASKDSIDKSSDTKSPERRIMRSGNSTEVQVGSLKDKTRGPGPRISSCDIPPSNYSDTKSPERRIMRSGMSTEVQVGSLKDKTRVPGPRLSSCDIPPSNYMRDVKLDRRSKTLGSYQDVLDQAIPEQ